jgi:hypothetical protein
MLKKPCPMPVLPVRSVFVLARRAVIVAVALFAFGLAGIARADGTATPTMPGKPVTLPAGSELQHGAVQVAPIPEPGMFPLVAVAIYLCFWKFRRWA